MEKSVKIYISFCLALFIIVLGSQDLFAQKMVKGKMIKQGLWKNHKIEYVADELCVFVQNDKTKEDVLSLFSKYNGTLDQEIDDRGFTVVNFPDSTDIISIANVLTNNKSLTAIEPNAIIRAFYSPNDTYYSSGKQWALYNYGQNPPSGTSGADIDIRKAWDIVQGLRADTVAVLDSGIPIENGNLSHDDLDDSNRFILGDDYTDENDNNSVKDNLGHGTHVLGIIGAETNNNEGIAGVVKDGIFLILQVIDGDNDGTISGFYNAVINAVDNGAKVINFSGGLNDYQPHTTLESAVSYADNNNVIIVAAAGNDSYENNMYPARYASSYDNVNAVSATDHNDQYSSYSNAGGSTNIFAPGGYGGAGNPDSDDIYSTTPNYSFYLDMYTTEEYGYMAGTSMSAPFVSGVAALILSMMIS